MTASSQRPTDDAAGREAKQRKRRADVFGDVLPDRTSDERGDAGVAPDSGADDWWRRQVPPHHG